MLVMLLIWRQGAQENKEFVRFLGSQIGGNVCPHLVTGTGTVEKTQMGANVQIETFKTFS